ncbi:putative ribonuclease H-like domain-containing protein, partial [Tanacetum coccineum]
MESISAQVVAAAKLPLLNPNEFKLWKMRIKQYFLMTDYALWEVILNSDLPLPTRTIDGVESVVPPTTIEQKLARKNELKVRGTLLMALPNEHQLKFNTYKDAKTLMEAIKKRFREGLDQIYDRLQKLISQLEIHGETISQEDVNLKLLRSLPSEWKTHTLIWRNKPDLEDLSMDDFIGSTNEAVKTAHGVSAANSKANASTLPNVDSLSDAVIYSFFASQSNSSQLDNEDLKQIDPDDLEEIDLKWQMAIPRWNAIIATAEVILPGSAGHPGIKTTKIGSLPEELCHSSSSDTEVSTCSKACLKSYETLKEHYDNLTKDFNKSQLNVGAYKAGLESVEASLDVYKKNEAIFEEDIKILKLDIMLRDNALIELRKKFEKAEKERDDLKHTLENQVFDSQVKDRYKTGEGYHVVPPPYTGNFMPPKPNLVLDDKDEYVFSKSATSVPLAATSEVKTSESKPKSVSEPLIEDWISDSENENEIEFKSRQRKPSNAKVKFVKSNEHVKSPRESVKKVENYKQAEYPRKNSQSPRAVLMKSGLKILNTARQNSSRATISVNTARPINTAYLRPIVNSARTTSNVFNRAHSHVRRPFNKYTTNKNINFIEKVNIVRENVTTVGTKAVVNDNKGNEANAVKASAYWVWRPKQKVLDYGNPQLELQEKGVIDSGCSRHMIGNKSYLSDYEEIDGGFVAFGGNSKGGKTTRKGKIRIGKLDFKDVYFVKELKFNLFSVSQMCDKKNSVLFTDTECVVLSSDFKLTDENHVLLKVPRKDNMYNIDLRNVVPQGGLTCLFAKATLDESNLWHRRLGHINFKNMNKLVRGNLVRGLPSKIFENDHTCVACQKGKQHKASCKTKTVSSISQPLQMLHMDLFGPTFVKSIMKKMYCLVVTDDFSRFSWVFFLATKDETSGILKAFITGIQNQINHRVKIIRSDNGTKFKNKEMNQFCEMKGIKREFSVVRTPQQNGVAKRKNRTLIEAARTMLADLKLPTIFWAEADNTACYVQNM